MHHGCHVTMQNCIYWEMIAAGEGVWIEVMVQLSHRVADELGETADWASAILVPLLKERAIIMT